MSGDVLELLDRLEEARAKATPGPWRRNCQPGVIFGGSTPMPIAAGYTPADAACIVAEHNACGPLAQAVRELVELEASYPLGSDVPVYRLGRILTRLESALSEGQK